jgi:hypothetical protein
MIFEIYYFMIFSSFITLNTSGLESNTSCEIWTNEHVYFAEDVHFFNQTFPFVKIDSIDDLVVTTDCPPREFNQSILKIFAKENILLDNDLDFSGVVNIFNSSHFQNEVWFQNVNGFNENNIKLTAEKALTLSRTNKYIRLVQITNVILGFYRQGYLLKSEQCKIENFDSETNFFGQIKTLFLQDKVFYNHKICPYVFMNTRLERLDLYEISNSLIFMNTLEFLNISESPLFFQMKNKLEFLNLCLYNGQISAINLNPFAFQNLKYLVIKGSFEYFDKNLFADFQEIRFVSIKSDALINFFHRGGTKWLNSINKNLNINLKDKSNFRQNIHRLVSIQISVQSWFVWNTFYTFPNEDICLFKNFPHSQLVVPLIIFYPAKFDTIECSCTLIWLQQYYKLYFSKNFTIFDSYITIEPEYKDIFVNESSIKCVTSEEKFTSCKFSQRFEKCDFITKFKSFPLNGLYSLIFTIKWLQYIIEVYMRTFLCLFGLITNFLALKVIRNKYHRKNFSNPMYKHIFANSLFNIGFCLIFLCSLINICIFSKTSFCSSVWQTQLAQYFYIYVMLFMGNSFRLCCNISYIFFSISRFALSGTSNNNRLRLFIEKQNVIRFYILLFAFTTGFSSFFLFENKVNKLFQDYSGIYVANSNSNNAYDIRYCDSFRTEYKKSIEFFLSLHFYVKCEIFKWLNLVNNILNNGLFFIVSIFVDIFMIRYSNKVIKQKQSLNCPNLSEAIHYKEKLNKMIITNGILYFFSHFPEFIFTLMFYFLKSDGFINFFYMAYDCTSIVEMAQVFHFISIGFQFFAFLKFDQNFAKSLVDLRMWRRTVNNQN